MAQANGCLGVEVAVVPGSGIPAGIGAALFEAAFDGAGEPVAGAGLSSGPRDFVCAGVPAGTGPSERAVSRSG